MLLDCLRTVLILLRHRIGVVTAVLRGALQQGHRARVVARATIKCRRIVAIEFATCCSGRAGSQDGRHWETSDAANLLATPPAPLPPRSARRSCGRPAATSPGNNHARRRSIRMPDDLGERLDIGGKP